MKRILLKLYICMFFSISITAKAQSYSIPVYLNTSGLTDNVSIQDVVISGTTTQFGITTGFYYPIYGIGLYYPDYVQIYGFTPIAPPTGYASAYQVSFNYGSTYLSVYNNSNSTLKGSWGIQFNYFSQFITSGTVVLPPRTTTIIPLNYPMSHQYTFSNVSLGGAENIINIWYNDSKHQ